MLFGLFFSDNAAEGGAAGTVFFNSMNIDGSRNKRLIIDNQGNFPKVCGNSENTRWCIIWTSLHSSSHCKELWGYYLQVFDQPYYLPICICGVNTDISSDKRKDRICLAFQTENSTA